MQSTEEAFSLPTQQPQVQIPALLGFFLVTAKLVYSIEIKLIWS